MITYEQAKQLKDAGFSKKNCLFYWVNMGRDGNEEWTLVYSDSYDWHDGGASAGKNDVACPTISELIEECGNNFHVLHRWITMKGLLWGAADRYGLIEEGKSPEEAVAKLWLKLNK